MYVSRILLICCLPFIIGCVVAKSGNSLNGISRSFALVKKYGRLSGEFEIAYLKTLAQRIGKAASTVTSSIDPEIIILNTDTPLAISFRPNYILISRSLIERLENEAQLAFIVAHEMAHNLFLHEEQPHRTRRELELEADRYGLSITTRAGYSAQAAAKALLILQDSSNSEPLNGYPTLKERVALLRPLVIQVTTWPATIDRRDFTKLKMRLSGGVSTLD